MGKWYFDFNTWLAQKAGLANWGNLYGWFMDSAQKIGIGGIILGLYQRNASGISLGIMLMGISAIMAICDTRSKK